jgi:hypothetical protein
MNEYHDLLEYETETEHAPEIVPLVPVRVAEPVVAVPAVAQHILCSTVIVSSIEDTGIEQILPQDPLRIRATIIVYDNPVVLCHSRAQAQAPANKASSTHYPSGAYVPNGTPAAIPIVIEGTAPLWAAATTAAETRIAVIAERRDP